MLKFLRKYNKIILVFGGSFLMVVFLLPQAIQQVGGSPFSRTVATLNGKKISSQQIFESQNELRLATQVVPELFQQIIPVESAEHWYLLTLEAERAGLIGGVQDAALLRDFAVDLLLDMSGISPQFRDQFAQQVRSRIDARYDLAVQATPPEQVDRALAKVMGVIRMFMLYETSDLMSEQEAIRAAREMFDRITASVAIIPPEAIDEQNLPEITEQRLREHFEAYKDVRPSENEYGIGYLRPPAVQLEWITIPREAISERIVLDDVEVIKFWRQERERNESLYPAEFSEARPRVEQAYRRQETDRVLDKVNEIVRRRTLRARQGLGRDGEYYALPDDWDERKPDLDELAADIAAEIEKLYGIEDLPIPVRRSDGEFRTRSEVSELEGIGASRIQVNAQRTVPFAEYVFNVREIATSPAFPVQRHILYGPADRGSIGDRYFFRIVDARPQSPPESLAEVREQAEENLRLLDAMAYFEEHLTEYRDRFSIEQTEWFNEPESAHWEFFSVEVTGEAVRTLGTQVIRPDLNTEAFRDAILDVVSNWDPKKPPSSFLPSERTLAMTVPQAGGLVIAQVRQRKPLTLEQYRRAGLQVEAFARGEFVRAREDAPFSFERMKERMNFKPIEAPDEPGGEPAEDEAAAETQSESAS